MSRYKKHVIINKMTENFVIQKKAGGVTMKEKVISERIKKGVKIDAEFPQNMVLAYHVLWKEGFSKKTDYLYFSNQNENQLTTVRYLHTVPVVDERTGKKYNSRHFEITTPPNQYDYATEIPKGVIRSEEDIFRF